MPENLEKNPIISYLLIVVVIKYSLEWPRWRKPEVEMIQNRQFITTMGIYASLTARHLTYIYCIFFFVLYLLF